MQNKQNMAMRGALLLATTLLSLTVFAAAPSQALVRDSATVSSIMSERNQLLLKEQRLLQDYDDLQKRLLDLQKQDADPRQVDQLCRDIDKKYSDLSGVRWSIRNLELRLL